jgi:hypothetical protein
MTRCATDHRPDLIRRLDEAADRIVPSVTDLLRQLAPGEPSFRLDGEVRALAAPLRFPDAIGHGVLVARVFRYRTAVRVDVEIQHDRMLATSTGGPTSRHCFLNDFVASIMLPPDVAALPEEFARGVLTGVRAAVNAVEAHNRHHKTPWSQIRVVAS